MALAIQTDLEPIGGVQRPAPAKRQREPRHRCTLCGSRKVSEDFPLTTGDIRKHVTCTQCLEASFTQPAQWQELGLQEPKKGGHSAARTAGTPDSAAPAAKEDESRR